MHALPCLRGAGRLLQHADQDNRLQAEEQVTVLAVPDMKTAPAGERVQLSRSAWGASSGQIHQDMNMC